MILGDLLVVTLSMVGSRGAGYRESDAAVALGDRAGFGLACVTTQGPVKE